MAQWITASTTARWILEHYGAEPNNPSAKVLVRALYAIDRAYTQTILDALAANTKETDPYANNVKYSGDWRISKLEARPVNDGSLSGSDVIVETLGQGFFSTLSDSNRLVVKTMLDEEQQAENAWMYYERGVVTETSRYINLAESAIFPTSGGTSIFPYITAVTMKQTLSGYDSPVIDQCWYEKEQDGSYSLYRSLVARQTVATLRTRAVKYGGMIIVDRTNLPIDGDNHIHLSGFVNQTETIEQHAKFILGSETFRVTAQVTASGGAVAVGVAPLVTATTEDYCDNIDGNEVQVYWEALT